MGIYQDQVLPRVTDAVMSRREFTPIRERVSAALDGEVLEIGFGSGLNVPHYPAAVTRVRAVDPATGGRRLAAKRVAASPVPVEYVGLDGQELPVDPASIDHVLTTWTLCAAFLTSSVLSARSIGCCVPAVPLISWSTAAPPTPG
jgi:ubiquinone/menaquinone biosynthesis C-methylase UbiE